MSKTINDFIKLLKKIGDKIVIYDSNSEESFVLLTLEEYERLLEKNRSSEEYVLPNENKKQKAQLTTNNFVDELEVKKTSSKELIDKINEDISIWKAQQEKEQEEIKAGVLKREWNSVSDLIKNRYDYNNGKQSVSNKEDNKIENNKVVYEPVSEEEFTQPVNEVPYNNQSIDDDEPIIEEPVNQ